MHRHQFPLLAPSAAANNFLKFRPELLDGVFDRPAGAVGEAANRRPGHDADGIAHFFEDLQVLHAAVSTTDAVGDLHHPAGPFAARRTLPARFVGEKAAGIVKHIDDARCLVEDDDCGGAQPQATDLARAVEIQRRVELGLGHEAHAEAGGNAALGFATFPDAATVFIAHLAGGAAERARDAA